MKKHHADAIAGSNDGGTLLRQALTGQTPCVQDLQGPTPAAPPSTRTERVSLAVVG